MKDKARKRAAILRQMAEDLLKNKTFSKRDDPSFEFDILKLIHELEVQQIELEIQNEELLKANDELLLANSKAATAAKKYQDLYDFAPSGYFTLSKEGVISEVNLKGAQLLGTEPSLLIKSYLGHFISDEMRPTFYLFLETIFSTKSKQSCEVQLRLKKDAFVCKVYISGTVSEDGNQCQLTMLDITDIKNAEIKIIKDKEHREQSEQRNEIIMNSALNAIITVDDRGQITYWNDQAESVFGWKKEEVFGKVFTDFMIPARNKELWNRSIYQYLNEGDNDFVNKRLELIGVHKSGYELLAEISITPIIQDGETYFCAFLHDISKRKETENQLYQTVELLKTLLVNLPSGILVEDESQKILYSNQLFWDLNNRPVTNESMEGVDFSQSYDTCKYLFKNSDHFVSRVQEIVRLREPVFGELMETTDNRFLERTYIPISIDNQNKGNLWKYADVTKRKEVENKLSETTAMLKALLFNIQSSICVLNDNKEIIFANQNFCDMRGLQVNPEELIGQNVTVLLSESKVIYKENYAKRPLEIVNGKQIILGELLETKDNRFIETDYIPFSDDTQNKAYLLKSTDVTQRIRNQNLLEQSDNRSNLIMNASLNAIITIDIKGIITFWNKKAEIIFGWNKAEVLGKELSEIIIPHQYVEAHHKGMKHYLKTGEGPALNKPLDLTALNRKGVEFPVEMSIIPIHENDQVFFCAFIQDVSEKKEAENSRKIQEEKYQNVIAHMNLGLLEVDNGDAIQYVNQSFADISGYERSELIGKKPSDFFVFEDNFDLINSKNKLRKLGTSDSYEIPIKNKRGELRYWVISGAPNYDSKGNVIGSIGIHLDVTEQKQLEIDLEKEKIKALESSKAKEIFLANMSHEIRTPLNAIIGFLRELQKQELSEIQKKHVDNSTLASKHLLAIVNNILDISKIEAGEMSIENEDFIFEKSILAVTTVLQPKLEQKGLHLNVTISNKIEKVLNGDSLRLQQILFNLIGNAIKFTNRGGISINCELAVNSDAAQELQISIIDTGIGMESDFIKNIFKKFSQEDKTITRKYGGTGLGLSITKELVNLMGGRIEVESQKAKGTSIHIYLNFRKGDFENGFDNQLEKRIPKIDNVRILLVEDNYLNLMVAQNSLHYYNFKVTEAINGLEAIAILKKRKFDIILMDIQMPEMGGIEATKIIRTKLNLSTPIIALTANAFKTEIDECRKAGMDDYITKPFDEDILIETIAKYARNKKTAISDSILSAETGMHKLYNLTSLHNLSRGNNQFEVKMINIFVVQTTKTIEKITEAILLADYVKVSRLIHFIRPSITSLGITSITKELQLLEKTAKDSTDKEKILFLFKSVKTILEKAVIQLQDNELNP
jgi:PAS domain S-box-containing protein